MTVTELSDALGIATPNVSQHLSRLSAGRLVGREKQGRTVHYRTIDPSLRRTVRADVHLAGGAGRTTLGPAVPGQSGLRPRDRDAAPGPPFERKRMRGASALAVEQTREVFSGVHGAGQVPLLRPGRRGHLGLRRLRLEAHQEVPARPGHRPVAGAVGADPRPANRSSSPPAGSWPGPGRCSRRWPPSPPTPRSPSGTARPAWPTSSCSGASSPSSSGPSSSRSTKTSWPRSPTWSSATRSTSSTGPSTSATRSSST